MRETAKRQREVPGGKWIFEDAPIPRAVAEMAVPTVITQLINIVYNFADTWYVGRTGNAAMVAALSVCMPIYVYMAAIANLFGIGGSSAISRSLGRKQTGRARHIFAFCLFGGLVAALLYALIMLVFGGRIIPLIGGDDRSSPYVRDYIFWTMILGAIPTVGNVLCGHLVRSIGAAKQAGFGMSMGAILNIVLDPLFMFVILPPGHEVAGAAAATLISNTASLLYFLVFLVRHRENPVFTVNPAEISFSAGIPGDVLLVGIPAALQTMLAMTSNIFANALVRGYGSEAVAGMGVAKKINMIAFNTTMGLTQGILPLLGYNYGAGNYRRMRKTIRFTAVIGLVFTTSCLLVFRGFAVPMVRFFIAEEKSVAFGSTFLRIIAFAAPLCTFSYLMNAVFQASGWKRCSLVLSVCRKGLLDIPAMFFFRGAFGALGVVLATPFAETLSLGLAVVMYLVYVRKLPAPAGRKDDVSGTAGRVGLRDDREKEKK